MLGYCDGLSLELCNLSFKVLLDLELRQLLLVGNSKFLAQSILDSIIHTYVVCRVIKMFCGNFFISVNFLCSKISRMFSRLKKHYSSYEPTLRQLKHKYELAMKEKMLTKLERDRAVGQVRMFAKIENINQKNVAKKWCKKTVIRVICNNIPRIGLRGCHFCSVEGISSKHC